MKTKSNAQRITFLSIFLSIIFIQTFVPYFGYIPIPPLNPTIIHITVILAGMILGPKDGAIVGLFWGLLRWFKAIAMPATPLDPVIWINPLISVLPRVMVGIVSGTIFNRIYQEGKRYKLASVTASLAGSLTNTILVLTLIAIIYGQEYAQSLGIETSQLVPALLTIVATNGVAEALISAMIGFAVVKPLYKVAHRSL